MRVEQLYPIPGKSLRTEPSRFLQAAWVWCQEEPKNQGAWFHIEPELELILTELGAKHKRPRYAGRIASASPATGLASRHKFEQETLVNEALG